MSWTDYDIVGSYNNQRVSSIDAERSINLFEYLDLKGKKKKVLLPTSGIFDTGIIFNTSGGWRAQFVFLGVQYGVVGQSFIKITGTPGAYVFSKLGTLTGSNTGYVGMDANTFQVLTVDGTHGYIFDVVASTFVQITDSSFPATPIDCCYLDGFFVVANGGTNNFQLSEFNQGLSWGPASNQFTTNNGALPNQLIVGVSNLTGGPSGTANYQTGIDVQLTVGAGGSLAGTGLAVATTYYTIFVDATHVKLATSLANAQAGTAITLTGDVTAIVNIVSNGQLQQGSITSHPGNIVACRTLHRRLFLFSSFYTEVWENAGIGTNLPFRRNNSFLIEYGTPSIGSIQVGFDMMFFLSQDKDGLGSVMKVSGTQAFPVSTRALDFQLAQYAAMPVPMGTPSGVTGVTDARGILIKENGLIFYRLNFTIANHTFVYNDTMSNPAVEEERRWHEEETLNGNRHPAQTHAFYNGVNYYGNYMSPILYQVDPNFSTNDGEPIRRARIGKPYAPETYQRIRIDRFHLDIVQGSVEEQDVIIGDIDLLTEDSFTLQTESGLDILLESSDESIFNANPKVFLSYSKDGGQSYGNQLVAPMGPIGNRTFRTVWRKLGTIPRGQSFTPYVQFFNTIPFVILGAAWVFEVLPQ
jgi:hypothetical protein